ncbi:hypothetical protein [Marinicella rhabdoformis]|uniref:hypothetical protein n=1 Tax=Marinicella rhabdoformis TaxID=2580566 RepID=UPI0012AEC26F|nr:hypothetical protein [Marinicella rhabdoformis]
MYQENVSKKILTYKKQCTLLLFLLLITTSVSAKKLKLRTCTLSDGQVVLMDKACPVNSQVGTYKKPAKKAQTQNKRHWHQQSATEAPKKQSKINRQTSNSRSKHNSELSINLNTLLASVKAPSSWYVQSFSVPKGDAITVSPKRLIRPNSLKTGATIKRFANTVKNFKKPAFSVAIDMFHQIRFDENIELTESEFIAHSKFKVFNVHYQKKRQRQHTLKIVVQFYVDEDNDDLYVVQFQAPKTHWSRLNPIKNQLFTHINL